MLFEERTRLSLERAEEGIRRVRLLITSEMDDVVARECYFVAFHAAMALLFERHDLWPKTHMGLHSRFAAEVQADPKLPRSMSEFLVFAYRFKQVADYGEGHPANRTTALAAFDRALDFLARIRQALEEAGGG